MKDYKKILEGLVNIINNTEKSDIGFANICTFIGENCPELKENEDERIRKEIINYIDKATGCKRWVAWLEKQCEKPQGKSALDAINEEKVDNQNCVKPSVKGEPKFKVGDWVIDKQGIVHQVANVVENVTNHTYGYDIVGGGYFNDTVEGVRLWNISDANDGDILHSTGFHNDCIFIFNGLDNWKFDEPNGDRAVATGYCCLSVSADNMEFGMQGPDCVEVNTVKPATKIQRDLLFRKIKEAGYEWDAEKKELKEIKNEEYDGDDYGIDSLWHAKNILEKTLGKVDGYQSDDGILDHKCAITAVDKLYKQPQSKQEWSEEDESNFQMLIDVIKENKHHATDYEHMKYYKLLSWFKSLKDRYTWKPSEEQMNALDSTLQYSQVSHNSFERLNSLYNELKKLK